MFKTWSDWNNAQIKLLQKRNRIERELVAYLSAEQRAKIEARLARAEAAITTHAQHYVPSQPTYAFGSGR